MIQTISSLSGGTSAPNTVVTEYAVRKYHLQTQLDGWLIQAPAPLTAAQVNAARQLALAYGVTVETRSGNPTVGEFVGGATALGLLGAILGMAGALVAGLAWAHSSLSAMFGDLPLTDVLILLAGLPPAAAVGGWLLAGREPEAISRQPLD